MSNEAVATPRRWHWLRTRFALRHLLRPGNLIPLACVVLVAYLGLVPVGYLLWGTFYDGASITLRFFGEAYSAFGLAEMFGNSLVFAVGSTLISLVIGVTLAYLTVRTDVPCKSLLFAASLVPLIIPGILHTISWIFLLSPRIGIVNSWLEPIFGTAPLNIFSIWGMVFVQGLHNSPLVFLLMFAAFRSMDPALEESALMSGSKLPTVLRRVTLPLVRPALYTSILIMMVQGLESFEVPALLGIPEGIWLFTSRIWLALGEFPPNYGQAGALSITLLVITTIGVFWQSRLQRQATAFQTVTGKGFRPRPMELGRWRIPALILVVVYFGIAVILPLATLLYASLIPFYASPSAESFSQLTLQHYAYVMRSGASVRAAINSFVLATGSATAVMLVMAVIAWIVVRTRLSGRWILDNLTFLPFAVPGLVLGVALLYIYLRFPLPIYGTLWILAIAYFTKSMPLGMRYASASMYQISSELEESAHASGATWWQTFRRINVPLLFPGLLAGWIYLVMGLVRELSSSILLYSPGNEVLAIRIWEMWENGELNELAALGIVMVVLLVILVTAARRLGSRVGVSDTF
jgi:iron(III) transport system permease protein